MLLVEDAPVSKQAGPGKTIGFVFVGGLLILTAILLVQARPPGFGPAEEPAFGELFAIDGALCEYWDRILRESMKWSASFHLEVSCGCAAVDPRPKPPDHISHGQVAMVLVPGLPSRAASYEVRDGRKRYFVLMVNPYTWNKSSLIHELHHLGLGHSAIQMPYLLRLPANTILDFMIDISGMTIPEWLFVAGVMAGVIAAYFRWRRRLANSSN